MPNIFIENVSSLIRNREFDIYESLTEQYAVRALKRIQYPIIHRYPEYATTFSGRRILTSA